MKRKRLCLSLIALLGAIALTFLNREEKTEILADFDKDGKKERVCVEKEFWANRPNPNYCLVVYKDGQRTVMHRNPNRFEISDARDVDGDGKLDVPLSRWEDYDGTARDSPSFPIISREASYYFKNIGNCVFSFCPKELR